MSAQILGLGTAVPQYTMNQQEAVQLATDVCAVTQRQQRVLEVLYRKAGVKNRHTVLPHQIAREWIRVPDTGETDGGGSLTVAATSMGPTTRERMEFFEEEAPKMAARAVDSALAQSELDPAHVTHLITVSCTGFAAPGVDIELIHRFGLPATTERVQVGFMGCHGAINGLRVAQAIAESNLDAKILLCAVECCSLHYRFQWDPDGFVGNALFADGAAALICTPSVGHATGQQPGSGREGSAAARKPFAAGPTLARGSSSPRRIAPTQLVATGSCLIPNSRDAMTWKIGDHGFEMYLSSQVPELIERHLRPWLSQWLAEHDLTLDAIRGWAVHPGGPKILQAVESSLGLSPDDLAFSRGVLSTHGNMSSATMLFILERMREQAAHLPCVALGFGPGLVAEAALLALA